MVLRERPDETTCRIKGRKQATSLAPGARSFSHPIQERGQFSKSPQWLETSGFDTDVVPRFMVEVFAAEPVRAMELTTILNHCHHFRGFVYQHARFGPDKKSIEVAVRPLEGTAAICSGCGEPAPGCDRLPERRFEFIPFWGFLVFFRYSMRRVNCRQCGVVVEEVPWGDGKHQLTGAYMLFLAHWARQLSWKETVEAFRTSWEKVCDAVEYVVTWGLEHRTLVPIRAIGVDEIQYRAEVYSLSNTAAVCAPSSRPYPTIRRITAPCFCSIHA